MFKKKKEAEESLVLFPSFCGLSDRKANCVTALSFSFLIHKMGIIVMVVFS